MNTEERAIINKQGFNFIQNVEIWCIAKGMAKTSGHNITIFKSNFRLRYAIYEDSVDNPVRPRSYRDGRVVSWHDLTTSGSSTIIDNIEVEKNILMTMVTEMSDMVIIKTLRHQQNEELQETFNKVDVENNIEGLEL